MQRAKPSKEEKEFRHAELDAFIKRYNLEGLDHVLDWIITTIKEMISSGEIPETEEGVMKAMALIVSEHPEIDQYLRKFKTAAHQEMLNEIKQAARPN